MISDVDRLVVESIPEAPAPTPTPSRAGGSAWVIAALLVGAVVAVDPAGLVPTGPLRWTAIALATGIAVAVLVRRPVVVPRWITGLWVALIGVLLLATITAVDPLSAWIGTPDRRLGLLAWITFPALFLAGHAITSRAATRVVLRAGSLGAIVLGGWSAAEVLGHSPLGLEFANSPCGRALRPARVSRCRVSALRSARCRDRARSQRTASVAHRGRDRCVGRVVRAGRVADPRPVGRCRSRGHRDRGRPTGDIEAVPEAGDRGRAGCCRVRPRSRHRYAARRPRGVDLRRAPRNQWQPVQ